MIALTDRFSITNGTITIIATRFTVAAISYQRFTVSTCCSTLTLTCIVSNGVNTLSSITRPQKTLILIHLTLQTVDRGRAGTVKTSNRICTGTMTAEVFYIAFIDILITVMTCPPCLIQPYFLKYNLT